MASPTLKRSVFMNKSSTVLLKKNSSTTGAMMPTYNILTDSGAESHHAPFPKVNSSVIGKNLNRIIRILKFTKNSAMSIGFFTLVDV